MLHALEFQDNWHGRCICGKWEMVVNIDSLDITRSRERIVSSFLSHIKWGRQHEPDPTTEGLYTRHRQSECDRSLVSSPPRSDGRYITTRSWDDLPYNQG